jgi:hypothetical protein
MKKISKTRGATAALSLLALGAFAAFTALTAPVLTSEPLGGGRETGDTTISIRVGKDASPTVVHVPDLAVGESRTLRSDSGKDVLVTRTEEDVTLAFEGREIHVRMPGEGQHVLVMPANTEDVKAVVSGDGVKKVIVTRHGYGFSTGDGEVPALSAADFLAKQKLAALDGADARTRETVAKALDELVKKGAVIAPGLEGLPGGGDGDRVEIKVTKTREK